VAKNDSEALFWEMLRALFTIIGWTISGILTLFNLLITWLSNLLTDSQNRRREEQESDLSRRTIQGPHGDTATLKDAVNDKITAAHFPSTDDFVKPFVTRLNKEFNSRLKSYPIYPLFNAIGETALELYDEEQLYSLSPAAVISGEVEHGRYRDFLIAHQKKLVDPARTASLFTSTVINAAVQFSNCTESESHRRRYSRITYGGDSHWNIGVWDGSPRRERH